MRYSYLYMTSLLRGFRGAVFDESIARCGDRAFCDSKRQCLLRRWTVLLVEKNIRKKLLANERYCGNVLTWKTFTCDIFEHRKKRNRQDRDQYLYRNIHEAIISEKEYDAAQTLFENSPPSSARKKQTPAKSIRGSP